MKYKTLKQRLKIYEKMLSDYKKSLTLTFYEKRKYNTEYGLCLYLDFLLCLIDIKNDFPELWKQKPSHCYNNRFWWTKGSLKPRIKAIKKQSN